MTNSISGACRRPALLMAALCAALLPIGAYAAQNESSRSAPDAQSATSPERADELIVKDALSEYKRLREQDQTSKKPWWVLDAPWIAFGVVGIVLVWCWSARKKQELDLDVVLKTLEVVREWAKGLQQPKPPSGELADWQKKIVDQLVASISNISDSVTGANTNITKELSSALAKISSPLGGKGQEQDQTP